MKTLIAIWVAALLTGAGGTVYVNHAINEAVLQSTISARQLQPADNVVQLTSTQPLQATSDPELQPALGYKALNWNVTNLKVEQ